MSYTKKDFGTSFKQSLNKKFSNDWLLTIEMLKDGKLSTYLFLKTNFRLENNTPRTERICKNCMCNEIEDEEYFIIRCNKFTKRREELFELISSKVKYFTHLPDKQKLVVRNWIY